ncbi:glycosyltransferase [Eggerthellaceae bacterium zg-893]|nr:glycosyltransferase [Eggerthellaceae bacterium zg-893]
MDDPLLSIIVPVYNIAPYLDECLESLCGQTYRNLEVVCVDDGSTDGSTDVLRAWEARDKRVRVVFQPNGGVSRARNHGLDVATGDYVAFVDGDDYLDLDAAEKLLAAARENDADIVVFGGRAFPETRWVTEVFGPRDVVRTGDGCAMIFEEKGCIPSASNKIFRRSLIEAEHLRFNERLVLGEDTSFSFFAFPAARTVAFLSDRFYHYRFERAGSAVTENFKKRAWQLNHHVEVLDYIAGEWARRGLLDGRRTQLLGAICFIFYDFDELSPADRVPFARHFKEAFNRHFSPADLARPMGRNERYRYELFLELARDGLTRAQAATAMARYRAKMAAVALNRKRTALMSNKDA